jgi:hypothetical protein
VLWRKGTIDIFAEPADTSEHAIVIHEGVDSK